MVLLMSLSNAQPVAPGDPILLLRIKFGSSHVPCPEFGHSENIIRPFAHVPGHPGGDLAKSLPPLSPHDGDVYA